jgi:adenylate kinase
MRYKAILLFGAPGSGKGTQGKILGSIPGFRHNATGEIFRSLDANSEMGRIFLQYAGKGQLVPDEVTVRLWRQYLSGLEMVNQFYPRSQILVLDGMPRNLAQAKLLEESTDVLKVIYLRCFDLTRMVERLRQRALKENRFDDANDTVILRRLQEYDYKTRPVLDYYPAEKIHAVDATLSQIRVLNDILNVLVPIKERFDDEDRLVWSGMPTGPSPASLNSAPAVAATAAAVAAASASFKPDEDDLPPANEQGALKELAERGSGKSG